MGKRLTPEEREQQAQDKAMTAELRKQMLAENEATRKRREARKLKNAEDIRVLGEVLGAVTKLADARGVYITKACVNMWGGVTKPLIMAHTYKLEQIMQALHHYVEMGWPLDRPNLFVYMVNPAVSGTLRRFQPRREAPPARTPKMDSHVAAYRTAYLREGFIGDYIDSLR